MILKMVRLVNFRRFKDVTIEFPEGVVGVVGLNGVGKSTIFEAIAWVLYGPVAARTNAEYIKHHHAEVKEPCRVELEFIFNDDEYRIVREMSGKQLIPSASALMNGGLVAQGAEPVTSFIQQKIGLDFKSFFTSIFAKQKELNVLSTLNASERRPLILKMLGITSLDDVIKEIRSDISQYTHILESLKKQILEDDGTQKKTVLEKKINDYKKALLKKQKDLTTIDKIIKRLVDEIKKKTDEITQQNKHYQTLLQKKDELTEIKNKIEQRERLIKEEKKLCEKSKKTNDELSQIQLKIKKISVSDEQFLTIQEKKKSTTQTMNLLTKTIEQQETICRSIQREIRGLEDKKHHIQRLGADASCPTCDRALGVQYERLLQSFTNEILQKEQQIKQYEQKINQAKQTYEKEQKKHDALEKRYNYLQEKKNILQEYKTAEKYLIKDKQQQKIEYEELCGQLKKLETLRVDNEYISKKNRA